MAPRKRLGALLIEMGVIDEHQLNSALGHQKQWGGKLGSVLVQKGLCREADVVRVLSVHLGMPVINLGQAQIEPRALKMISRQIAEKLRVFPVSVTGLGRSELLTIAMAEPSDLSLVDQVAFHTGKRIKPVLTGESEIATAIAYYYNDAGPGQPKPGAAPASGRFTGGRPAASAPAASPAAPPAGHNPFANNPFAPPRPPSISQRPAPPAIAPPVMAPVSQVAAPSGNRPPSSRTPASPPPAYSTGQSRAPAQAQPSTPTFFPGPTPPPKPQPPLDEIESIDFESIPGMSPSVDANGRMPGLEPIAAHSQAPETVGWDEAPSTDPSLSAMGAGQASAWSDAAPAPADEPPAQSWDDAPAPPPEPQFAQPGAWSNSSDGAVRAPFYKDTMPGPPPQVGMQTLPGAPPVVEDELPADAIFGTADENEQLVPPAAGPHPDAAAPQHFSVQFESSPHEFTAPREAEPEYQSAPTQPETPAFFEAPAEPALPHAEPVAPDESAPQPARGVAVTEPALDVAPPLVDPWADLGMSDAAGTDEPSPAAAHEAWVADQVGAQAFTESSDSQLDPAGADLPPVAPAAAGPNAGADPASAQAHTETNEPWPSPDEALASVGARMQTNPGAFVSAPGSIVAPAAWGEVDDPLAVSAPQAEPPFTDALAAAQADDDSAAVDDAHAAGDVHAADGWPVAGSAQAAEAAPALDGAPADWSQPVELPASTTPDESASAGQPFAASEPEATTDIAFNSDEFAPVSDSSEAPEAAAEGREAAPAHDSAELSHEEVWPASAPESAPAGEAQPTDEAAASAAASPEAQEEAAPGADAAPAETAYAEDAAAGSPHAEAAAADAAPVDPSAHAGDAHAHAAPSGDANPEPARSEPEPVAEGEHAEAASAAAQDEAPAAGAAPAAEAAEHAEAVGPAADVAPAPPEFAAAGTAPFAEEPASAELPPAALANDPIIDAPAADAGAASASPEMVSEVHEGAPAAAQDEVVADEDLGSSGFADEETPAHATEAAPREELISETPVELAADELLPDDPGSAPQPEASAAGDAEAAAGSEAHLAHAHPDAPLSAYDVETLAGVGIDVNDSAGAMRLLAGLLRALAARGIIDLGELTVDLYAQRAVAPEAGESHASPEPDAGP